MRAPKRGVFKVMGVAVGLTALLAACGPPQEGGNTSTGSGGTGATGPIEIALIGDLTGPAAPYSTATKAAVEIAFDEANAAGGINGRQLKLQSYDDTNDPIQTVNIAKRSAPSAAAVILASASSPVLAAGPELEKIGKPFFVTVSSNPQVTTSGWKWVDRVHLSDADQIKRIVEYGVKTMNLKKIGIVHDTTDLGQGGLEAAKKTLSGLGQQPATTQSYNFGANDFTSQVNALRDAGVDSVLCWCLVDSGARVTEQLRALGMTNIPILGGGGLVSGKFIELSGAAAEGTVASWAYVDSNNTVIKALNEKYKAKTTRDVDVFAAQSYDAARILVDALKKAGTDPAALQKAIRGISYEGAVGKLTFDDTGQNVRQIRVGKVVGGKWTLLD